MSVKHVCDICMRTEQYCTYHIRKKWRFFVFEWDSQGGSNRTLDVCDKCFNLVEEMARKGVRE